MIIKEKKIAVIGLGYVGLPLAEAFSEYFDVIGFDINEQRVKNLQNSMLTNRLCYTTDTRNLADCNVFIVTVPTPVDLENRPDLTPLELASKEISRYLKHGDYVIYESTVYPGVTDDVCVPILLSSGLKLNVDFFVGYSPERINPGDKTKTVKDIKKVTSGSSKKAAIFIDRLYQTIITAGTHMAPSIRVAEASKVLENIQRDVNIALVNQVHQLFQRMYVDTNAVIDAAATKWNFMPVRPGLVGGHCIGVDPYYLIHKSTSVGYVPDLITTAREINDGMAQFFVTELIKKLIKEKFNIAELHIVIYGFSFKPDCDDIRNTKVVDVFRLLQELGIRTSIIDPLVDQAAVTREYGIRMHNEACKDEQPFFDLGLLLVPHQCFNLTQIATQLKHQYLYSLALDNLLAQENPVT